MSRINPPGGTQAITGFTHPFNRDNKKQEPHE